VTKKLRVLLIDCSRPLDRGNFSSGGYHEVHHPPVGLMAIASYVARSGFSSKVEFGILDASIDYQTFPELNALVKDFQPDVVGLRCLHWHSQQFHSILKLLKNLPTRPITIGGGPYVSGDPLGVMNNEPLLDFAISGEGEEIFLDLLMAIHNSRSSSNVLGLYYRDLTNRVIFSGDRPQNPDVDALGYPDWSKLDFSKYENIMGQAPILRKAAPILTSRGCPYSCTYCHDLFQKKFRARSAENIVEELELLHNLGVHDICVIDDIFNFDNNRVLKIFNLIAQKNLKLRFYYPNGLRGDRMPNEVVDAMVDGGSIQFTYALESGSPRIQKMVKKHLKFEKFESSLAYLLKKNVMVDLFMMVGFPSETEEEANQTMDFLFRFDNVCFPYLNVLNIFPGTALDRWQKSLNNVSDASTDFSYSPKLSPTSGSDNAKDSDSLKIIKRMRTRLMFDYMADGNRLKNALAIQKRYLTTEEIVYKYRTYFQNSKINSLSSIESLARSSVAPAVQLVGT
jgi:radical SAM superfamily enzyme YgiQ (UPF0313 family)